MTTQFTGYTITILHTSDLLDSGAVRPVHTFEEVIDTVCQVTKDHIIIESDHPDDQKVVADSKQRAKDACNNIIRTFEEQQFRYATYFRCRTAARDIIFDIQKWS